MQIVPTSDEVTIASFMKVLGTGSCGTVWLVADEADTLHCEPPSSSTSGSSMAESDSNSSMDGDVSPWQPVGPVPPPPPPPPPPLELERRRPEQLSELLCEQQPEQHAELPPPQRRQRTSSSLPWTAQPQPQSKPQPQPRWPSAAGPAGRRTGGSAPAMRRARACAAESAPCSSLRASSTSPPGTTGRSLDGAAAVDGSDGGGAAGGLWASPPVSPRPPLRRALKVSPACGGAASAIASEQDVLAQLHHPFIVRFHGSSSDVHKVYLCVEAQLSGDLGTLLREGTLLEPEQVRLVSACAASALGYLHERCIRYRDLKVCAPSESASRAPWRAPHLACIAPHLAGTSPAPRQREPRTSAA